MSHRFQNYHLYRISHFNVHIHFTLLCIVYLWTTKDLGPKGFFFPERKWWKQRVTSFVKWKCRCDKWFGKILEGEKVHFHIYIYVQKFCTHTRWTFCQMHLMIYIECDWFLSVVFAVDPFSFFWWKARKRILVFISFF